MEHNCSKNTTDEPKILNYYDSKSGRVIYYCHYCGEEVEEKKES